MRVDFIEPFAGSAVSVLREVLRVEAERGSITLEKGLAPKEDYLVTFGLTGDFEGTVLFDASEETVLGMASAMSGDESVELDLIALDCVAELMNIVIGRSVTVLNDMGFTFRITPPTVYQGRGMRVLSGELESFVVPVNMPFGSLSVSVSLKEAA